MPAATATTATIAAELGTTPRELRKYLRSADMGVGKGARYALPTTKREMAALTKKFTAWGTAQVEAKAAKAAAADAATDAEIDEADEATDTDD